ncbi:acetate/propionate family kinase [Halovibrio sp. HP20-50]|uniref:acetate/propionate family kinase n=1 Tax=Halovibrio sp. HP20-59 TaxID=3080275 RepID=UPI00294B45BD|nr:acetate/propionate family kinase [Halovibrio sp. HP20-59]MEA2119442.1 acetate/propionate family kinase [Halovibrio sp. HP20-59]
MRNVLVINSGSSSLKFALFAASETQDDDPKSLELRYRGKVAGLGGDDHSTPDVSVENDQGEVIELSGDTKLPESTRHKDALSWLLDWIDKQPDLEELEVVGHRVVHGGQKFHAPVVLDAATINELDKLSPLAPLHQPYCLDPVKRLAEQRPELTQVACFDTAFHTTQPRVAQQFALPRELTDKGLIRYGFHGLSYDYINRVLPDYLDDDEPAERLVVAHLGNGASLCAIKNGQSIASTMGFTALEGLPMGTRCGSLDAGLVLYLLSEEGMSVDEVSELLYKRSGLLGVSGISSDMRELLASDAQEAREAIELYVYRIAREIGSLAAAMGGLDQLVFTAGIGEHAAPVRKAVCQQCEWLGLVLDDDANRRHAKRIANRESRVGAWVIPTDEERMIAWHALRLIREASNTDAS